MDDLQQVAMLPQVTLIKVSIRMQSSCLLSSDWLKRRIVIICTKKIIEIPMIPLNSIVLIFNTSSAKCCSLWKST